MKSLKEYIVLNEGFDIDNQNKIVSFNNGHQDNVDTNDYIKPYIFNVKDQENNIKIISLFKRKDNDEGNDGNPIIYALKNKFNWKFKNPIKDIMSLMRRFVSIIKNLQKEYDLIIVVPSSNELNHKVYGYLNKLIKHKEEIEQIFEKIPLEKIKINYKLLDLEKDKEKILKRIKQSFNKMKKDNNKFSYQKLNKDYRKYILNSIETINDVDLSKYADKINDKHVLVFDDTVASGKTLSDMALAIYETFDPKSIEFITLFTPRENEQFKIDKQIL